MYVFKRKGSWYFEYQHRQRRRKKGGFPTKRLAELAGAADRRQAQERRIERVWGVKDHARALDDVPTLAACIGPVGGGQTNGAVTYATHHLPGLEASTQKSARSQLRRLIARLGGHLLDEIDGEALDRYVAARRADGVSDNHIREDIERLSRVINFARARGVIAQHPFRGWPRPRRQRPDIQILKREVEAQLLRKADTEFRDWIVIALDTGLRKGELRILHSDWVTWSANELRIMQPKVKRPKVIPLTPRTRAVLARRRHPGALLLGQPNGRAWSLPWIDRQWQRVRAAARLEQLTFNGLRHTFATRLAENGEPIQVVGELLGHKPPYTTTLRYYHALPEAKRRAIARLGRSAPRSTHRAGQSRRSSGRGSPRSLKTSA